MKSYSRFYKCEYFKIQELVDPETFKTMGDNAWSLFDPYLLSTMDRIRMRFNVPVTVNNWVTGGPFSSRGFRHPLSAVGSPLSAHKRGQAIDFDVQGMTADQVRAVILAEKEHIDFMFITRMEIGIAWTHIDCANVPNRIQLFSPPIPKAKV